MILLVFSVLFLDAFSSVSNEMIVVVYLAGRVVARGGLGDSRRCHQLQPGDVLQEVFDSRDSSKASLGESRSRRS